MSAKIAVAVSIALLTSIAAYADDADKPDPIAVIDAQGAAQRVGNGLCG